VRDLPVALARLLSPPRIGVLGRLQRGSRLSPLPWGEGRVRGWHAAHSGRGEDDVQRHKVYFVLTLSQGDRAG
jgi:hypothetical protein